MTTSTLPGTLVPRKPKTPTTTRTYRRFDGDAWTDDAEPLPGTRRSQATLLERRKLSPAELEAGKQMWARFRSTLATMAKGGVS